MRTPKQAKANYDRGFALGLEHGKAGKRNYDYGSCHTKFDEGYRDAMKTFGIHIPLPACGCFR